MSRLTAAPVPPTTLTMQPDDPLTLDNCDREPIHIPGHVQPHGDLLAWDRNGRLVAVSAGASSRLAVDVALGDTFDPARWPTAVANVLTPFLAANADIPVSAEVEIGGATVDLVVHRHQGRVIAEFERRTVSSDAIADFAVKIHRGIIGLNRQSTPEDLLQRAVDLIRDTTGFDRVMAYRFRQDDSGEVVAEARADDLDPYVGRCYPASDIPAQARRLYTLNTLRMIAHVDYEPTPLTQVAGEPPLDLSHAVLRSVSPIHVEYLRNMGIEASMSVSLVVDERLWGLIACHHRAPLRVPHSIRMACDVVAQIVSGVVQALTARRQAESATLAAALAAALSGRLVHDEEDVLHALEDKGDELASLVGADALLVCQGGRTVTRGALAGAVPSAIVVAGMQGSTAGSWLVRTRRDEWPEDVRTALGDWVGALGVNIDAGHGTWVVALRREQVKTVRWGGRPEKLLRVGPNGPRLTPRASFEEWVETVRDTAEPWTDHAVAAMKEVGGALQRAVHARQADAERARSMLFAMLGHDLRDPLQSISMAARLLERGSDHQRVGERLRTTTGRMQRMVSMALDLSRIEAGAGLGLVVKPIDVSALVRDLVDEARLAHPGQVFELAIAGPSEAHADPDRIAQVVTNLLSNARHHGRTGEPIAVTLDAAEGAVCLRVRNVGDPIDPAVAARLFKPFKATSAGNHRNPGGMGLGLFIADAVMKAHGGSLAYRHEAPHVLFEACLPTGERG